VASGVALDVEGGILPPGNTADGFETFQISTLGCNFPAGLEARLYGSQDACRHEALTAKFLLPY
jgi:hypothetical protein